MSGYKPRPPRELHGRPHMSGFTDETGAAVVRVRWRNGFAIELSEQDAELLAALLTKTVGKNRDFRERHGIELVAS